MKGNRLGVLAFVALLGGNAFAIDFFEVEANESKATASIANGLITGDRLIGLTTGSSTTVAGNGSADYWRVSTAVTALGIYRHRLVITTTGTAGHGATFRGLNQIAATAGTWPGATGTAGTTDTTIQTSSTATSPARMNQWYGFGKGESMYYRITGTASTTANYAVEYSMTQVAAMNLGMFMQGAITFTTMGTTTVDTDMWVYDANLNPITGYGNDDESINGGGPGTTLQSLLTRNYAQGVYYIALSSFSLTNNMGAACDDDFRTGALNDFGGSVLNNSTTTLQDMDFNMTDINGTRNFTAIKDGAFDVVFAKFVVVPEPATMAVLGLGIVPFLRKRRK